MTLSYYVSRSLIMPVPLVHLPLPFVLLRLFLSWLACHLFEVELDAVGVDVGVVRPGDYWEVTADEHEGRLSLLALLVKRPWLDESRV